MDALTAAKPTVDPRRYHESAAQKRSEAAESKPVCLYLETTNRCNLLCTTCPRTYEELEPPADMSWELFTNIVDQVPNIARAVLHGVGEPMLVKNLPRMVRYLKDRGTYVLFNTNGTVLNDRNGRALDRRGPRRAARIARCRQRASPISPFAARIISIGSSATCALSAVCRSARAGTVRAYPHGSPE